MKTNKMRLIQCILICIFLFSAFSIKCSAQSWSEVKANNAYVWGEGYGESSEEALEHALEDLISKICVVVSSSFEMTSDETTANGKIDSKQYVNMKMSTYTSATLTNAEHITLSQEPNAHVGCWIKRSDVDKIFESREKKVKEFFALGMRYEQEAKLDDALKYYYWSFTLLKSLPHNSHVTYMDQEGKKYNLLTATYDHINQIFSDVETKITGINGNYVNLSFKFRGKPVTRLDYTYFDGRNQSNICSAKNGVGQIEMVPGASLDNIKLKFEYAFKNEAKNIDKETASVLGVVKSSFMRKSQTTVSEKASAESSSHNETLVTTSKVSDVNKYKTVINEIVKAIASKNYDSVKNLFTAEGWDMYHKLVNYGSAQIVGDTECSFYKHNSKIVARSIPMSFSFKNGVRRNFVEDIVFTMTEDAKVECLAFGLDKTAQEDIMSKAEWAESDRKTLLEFMENYKTAYSLKRLDYIRNVFDDDAVIIVGHMARKMQKVSGYENRYALNRAVTRTQYSKEQYLKNLEHCFNSNEFINIKFGHNDVIRGGGDKKNIYGIQIMQDYYSSSYGDQGYLFLRIDLDNPDEPNISVRTWQPEPDPIDGLYNLGNF